MMEGYEFQKVLVTYCQSDVRLLKEDFEGLVKFNPMSHCITIALACNVYYRMMCLIENTIASESIHIKERPHLKAVLAWLYWKEHCLRQSEPQMSNMKDWIAHAGNRGEHVILIGEKKVYVDLIVQRIKCTSFSVISSQMSSDISRPSPASSQAQWPRPRPYRKCTKTSWRDWKWSRMLGMWLRWLWEQMESIEEGTRGCERTCQLVGNWWIDWSLEVPFLVLEPMPFISTHQRRGRRGDSVCGSHLLVPLWESHATTNRKCWMSRMCRSSLGWWNAKCYHLTDCILPFWLIHVVESWHFHCEDRVEKQLPLPLSQIN